MTNFAADSILVLLEGAATGDLAKSSAELIGAASQIGTPVALVVSEADGVAEAAASLGAEVVLLAPPASGLTIPVVDALVTAAELVKPDAVLLSNSIDGRDAAGRFAARTGAAARSARA